MEYIITGCTINELYTVAQMYNRLTNEIKDTTHEDYFEFDDLSDDEMFEMLNVAVNEEGLTIYVAKTPEGKIIGFISGSIKKSFSKNAFFKLIGYIEATYIDEQYRREGILKSLEEKLVEDFKNEGTEYIELNILSENTEAKASWQSMGYTTYREDMRKVIK